MDYKEKISRIIKEKEELLPLMRRLSVDLYDKEIKNIKVLKEILDGFKDN